MKNYRALALLEPPLPPRAKKSNTLLRVAGLVAVVGVLAWVFSSSEGDGAGGGGGGEELPPAPPAPPAPSATGSTGERDAEILAETTVEAAEAAVGA